MRREPLTSLGYVYNHPTINPMGMLKQLAPSVFTTTASPGRTKSYTQVPTSDIIEHLSLRGWLIESAGETYVRPSREEHRPWVAHTVNLRHPDFTFGSLKKGDVFPTILIGNSHNATTAVWMRLGFKVCVCDNQNVVSMSDLGVQRFRHFGGTVNLMGKIYESLDLLSTHTDKVGKVLTTWRNTPVTIEQRREYFSRAMALRVAQLSEVQAQNLMLLDERRRPQELGSDLYTMYQIVQEHTTRGHRTHVVLPNGQVKERTLVRGLTSTRAFVSFNEQLFGMTESFAKETVGV
jgi:Domain of unknown function (DUF932)